MKKIDFINSLPLSQPKRGGDRTLSTKYPGTSLEIHRLEALDEGDPRDRSFQDGRYFVGSEALPVSE